MNKKTSKKRARKISEKKVWKITNIRTRSTTKSEALKTTTKRARKTNKAITKLDTKKLVGMAMFAALAYSVTFVFRIPVMFLTFDAKDAIIIIASLIYGPVSGIIISLTVALIELITISGTGVYGFIMNFASSAVFSAVAALVYKYKTER